MTPRDLILAVLAALIWGATFPVTAVALDETPPLFFACLRFVGAAAFIAMIPRPQVPWSALLWAGLLLGAGQYGFLFVSMTQGISPGLASLLVHTQAIFTIIIAMVVFSEPLRWRQAAAIGLALCGLGLLAADRFAAGVQDRRGQTGRNLGDNCRSEEDTDVRGEMLCLAVGQRRRQE